MGKDTEISWCHSTANLWWGCSEVHAGCDSCYARVFARSKGKGAAWKGDRFAIKSIWDNLRKWNDAAAKAEELRRVFCGSMMDIFEKSLPAYDWQGESLGVTTGDLRDRYFREVVPATPNLIHMLLTKRPGNVLKSVPPDWIARWPSNVWTGASAVDQATANTLLPQLCAVPGLIFVSAEPLLGDIDMTPWLDRLGLVIVGGESGPHARAAHPDWIRSIRSQCIAAGVPFHFKQHGEWLALSDFPLELTRKADSFRSISMLPDGKFDHQIDRAACDALGTLPSLIYRVGKKAAGRTLDGRTWDEIPVLQGVTS